MGLEADLRALAVDWPATPALELALEPRRRRRAWPAVAAFAATAAVAAAFAVPQSRGAILRFFHLGGATVRVVDTLPPADEQPLTAGLGPVVPLASARRALPRLLLPPVDVPLHYSPGNVVSAVFVHRGRPVLLSELPGGAVYLKKLAAEATRVEAVLVGADDGLWMTGERHVVAFPQRSPRLAGNVLLWAHGDTTYRLEGPGLERGEALRLAQSLRKG